MPPIVFCTRILRLAQWTMTNEKPEPTDMDRGGTVDHERLQLRDRLEYLERKHLELIECDRLGTMDMADRERLEIIEREWLENLER